MSASALAMALLSAVSPAAAQSSEEVTALVDLLVSKGVITRAQADSLAAQAKQNAAAHAVPAAPADEGKMHITRVPDSVKKQIKDEVKQEVVAQAKEEGWATPNQVPGWLSRLHISGDVRFRYEGSFFADGNAADGTLPDWNAINTGSPYDTSAISNAEYAPQINADQDRNRYRIRARLRLDADLGGGFATGIGIATGNDASPVSANQSLGQNGGNFSKYALWLDRAYIGYQAGGFSAKVGRFDNPFFSTEMVWDDDIGFDGLALNYKTDLLRHFGGFATLGAFPVFNSGFNFATNQPSKYASTDKWLFAGQLGFDWQMSKTSNLRLAGAYYRYENIEGKLSSLCYVYSSASACDTDETRPSFAQYGNSYRPLRLIASIADNNYGTENLYQYYGLASKFAPVVGTVQYDYTGFTGLKLSLVGEYVKNVAFSRSRMENYAINNFTDDVFDGGDSAYFLRVSFGRPQLAELGDWSVDLSYRRVETDALVDAFTDSDFGVGGTNAQGFKVGGAIGLGYGLVANLRWTSTDTVGGAPLSVDTLRFDISAKY